MLRTSTTTPLLSSSFKNHPFFEAQPHKTDYFIVIPTSIVKGTSINTKDIKLAACKLIYKDIKHVYAVNPTLDHEKFSVLSVQIKAETSFQSCECSYSSCQCVKLADNQNYVINKSLTVDELKIYAQLFAPTANESKENPRKTYAPT